MRNTVLAVAAVVLLLAAAAVFFGVDTGPEPPSPEPEHVTTVATGLDIPWGIAFLPDGDLLVTERSGTLLRLTPEGDAAVAEQTYVLDETVHIGEGGLLGLALHPDFTENRFVYLYQTTEDASGAVVNQVLRYRLDDGTLRDETVILDDIPGGRYHNGGRIAFGPDDMLYITTGDAGTADLAQETDSLAGKILRLTPNGTVPADNPFDNPVHSYGHRNAQGLAWDDRRRLWATEHGETGRDELNRIEPGGNYGWPVIEGDESRSGMQAPVIQSGTDTWAPAGAAYIDGQLVFAGLRGSRLYAAQLDGATVDALRNYLSGQYGRLRAVTEGPDGRLYVTTSNRDGRGTPRTGDDRILRIDPQLFTE